MEKLLYLYGITAFSFMIILKENKGAVLKKGSSFDYINENRFFTDTMGILSALYSLCVDNSIIWWRLPRESTAIQI